jgi:hypothetical protein
MTLDLEIKVRDFKDKVAKLVPDMPADLQRAIYTGKILENDMSLKAYNIKHEDKIVVMRIPTPGTSAPIRREVPGSNLSKLPPLHDYSARAKRSASFFDFDFFGFRKKGVPSYEPIILDIMSFGFDRDYVETRIKASFGNADAIADYVLPNEAKVVVLAGEDGLMHVKASDSQTELLGFTDKIFHEGAKCVMPSSSTAFQLQDNEFKDFTFVASAIADDPRAGEQEWEVEEEQFDEVVEIDPTIFG